MDKIEEEKQPIVPKKDCSTAILDEKVTPYKLMVDEADADDNSTIQIT
jgi:hypothetical protein